ncbi:class I SAM-dependent methyltransferase [Streptomyces uncialis]|uniref:class I SAM-dependent methyltransferase n=1 Tax=Streptomyces uncialis TaxID=1048205 RepID=UPI003814A36C
MPPTARDWDDWHSEHAPYPVTGEETDGFLELTGMRPGAVVADLGCGTGEWARALAARGARVTGYDFSPGALRTARRYGNPDGYVHWDIDTGPVPRSLAPASVDVVTFRDSLHLLQVFRVLGDAARFVRPGGAVHIRENPAAGTDDPRFRGRLTEGRLSCIRTLNRWPHTFSRCSGTTVLVLRRPG